ncbi:chaplin [Streptomyces sp. TRM49041]|uniref:chaplin n=1 Tax=Streptomyces sp. TRM49041 TaxID=2603216 RepID=UPI0011EE8E4A|nr:chaplin [Streptomyces sp. TRM49041]
MSRIAKAVVLTSAAAVSMAGAAGVANADVDAHGATMSSPGVISGNAAQAPIHIPVGLCGNTADVIGALNPAFGNACIND